VHIDTSSENNFEPGQSVRSRFLVSILSNFLRGGFSFLASLIIARSLGPSNYGNYIFLISSFIALQQFLEMGTSKAFFTFISQRPRGKTFIKIYRIWQLIQFFIPFLIIGVLLPDAWISSIWIGQDKILVLLSFSAVFLQQNAWQTVVQIGESNRLTQKVQTLWLLLVVAHFVLVATLWLGGGLSLTTLFCLIIIEYSAGIILGERALGIHRWKEIPIEFKSMIREYAIFCSPLVIYSWASFASDFSGRWLLQKFGGNIEQGFYGVGYQFAMVCGLFAASIHKIFWKEIAEAREGEDIERIRKLYKRITRLIFILSAAMSGFLVPWSQEIIQILLGISYVDGRMTLAVMLLFPVHQSLVHITGALYWGSQKTKVRSILGIIFMAVNIPITYFVLAPKGAWLPGLELGSLGMALTVVISQIIMANVLVWWISRDYGWKFDWVYQLVGLGGALLLGGLAYYLVMLMAEYLVLTLLFKVGSAFILYCIMAGYSIWLMPWIAGVTRQDIKITLSSLKTKIYP